MFAGRFAPRSIQLLLLAPSLAFQPFPGGPGVAWADEEIEGTPDVERQAAARALFQEGLGHADAGRWREAADRFERAHSLRPTPEIGYNLSTALVKLGRLVHASELLRQLKSHPRANPEVRRAAAARLAQVLPRLAHLTIEAGGLPERAAIRLDGKPLDPALVGVAFPVDPGLHLVEAYPGGDRGRGGEPLAATSATLAEGARETVRLQARPAEAGGLFARPWFWGVVGAAAVGVGAAVLLGRDPERATGNVDTWRLGAR
jgi:tetratricopeptide (TPR) repeat protein